MSDLKTVGLNLNFMDVPVGVKYEIVNALPASGEVGVFYFISNGTGYDTYIWVNNDFEKL